MYNYIFKSLRSYHTSIPGIIRKCFIFKELFQLKKIFIRFHNNFVWIYEEFFFFCILLAVILTKFKFKRIQAKRSTHFEFMKSYFHSVEKIPKKCGRRKNKKILEEFK